MSSPTRQAAEPLPQRRGSKRRTEALSRARTVSLSTVGTCRSPSRRRTGKRSGKRKSRGSAGPEKRRCDTCTHMYVAFLFLFLMGANAHIAIVSLEDELGRLPPEHVPMAGR